MIVQRGYAQSVVQCDRQDRIDFILEQDGVAHYHGFGVRAFCKCGPCPEAHEWRHRPTVDGHSDVGTRKCDAVNALRFVPLAFEVSNLVDLCDVERGRSGASTGAAKRDQQDELFHKRKRWIGRSVGDTGESGSAAILTIALGEHDPPGWLVLLSLFSLFFVFLALVVLI